MKKLGLFANTFQISKKYLFRTGLEFSLATPLFEQGLSLGLIQKLMGKSSSETTGLYIHISKTSLANTKSPLDYIVESQKADNEQVTTIKT